MTVVAALSQIRGDGILRGQTRRERSHQLASAHGFGEPPGGHPSDTVSGSKTFCERPTIEHDAFGIEGFRRFGASAAEVQFSVDIVLDERYLACRKHADQLLASLIRHQRAQRVLKAGHEPTGAHRVAVESL